MGCQEKAGSLAEAGGGVCSHLQMRGFLSTAKLGCTVSEQGRGRARLGLCAPLSCFLSHNGNIRVGHSISSKGQKFGGKEYSVGETERGA